jgi:hypothetical protein
MPYFITIACVVCGWAVLRIVGSERAALMIDMEARVRRAAKSLPAPTPDTPPQDPQSASPTNPAANPAPNTPANRV